MPYPGAKQRALKALTSLMVLVFSVVSVGSASAGLDSAFSSLTSSASTQTYSGGAFESQTRNIYSFGGARIRFPQSTVQFVSITPPSFGAGCNGIDAHFGGFSFINGEQFQTLLRNIGQAALGYVVMLALKQLCPQCEAVMEAIQKAAQLATKLAVDSCSAGTALAKQAVGLFGGGTGGKALDQSGQSVCGKEMANKGESDGFLSAINDTCNSMDKWTSKVSEWIDTSPDSEAEAAKYAGTYGNTTWLSMKTLGFVKSDKAVSDGAIEDGVIGELFMSMIGTSITADCPVCANGVYSDVQPPTLTPPEVALDLFMCGVDYGTLYGSEFDDMPFDTAAEEYCTPKDGSQDYTRYSILTCDNEDYSRCEKVTPVALQDWTNGEDLLGYGFIAHVEVILLRAVKSVQERRPLSAEALGLIHSAPLPLYKAINIAAVYPAVSKNIIHNNAVILAHLMAQEYFRHILSEATLIRQGGLAPPPEIVRELLTVMNGNYERIQKDSEFIDRLVGRQNLIISQIKQVNKVMQDTVFSRGLGGNQLFSGELTSLSVSGR